MVRIRIDTAEALARHQSVSPAARLSGFGFRVEGLGI